MLHFYENVNINHLDRYNIEDEKLICFLLHYKAKCKCRLLARSTIANNHRYKESKIIN